MTRWEYCEIDLGETSKGLDELDMLNRAGAEGWELVAIRSPNRAMMKRQVAAAIGPRAAKMQAAPDARQPK